MERNEDICYRIPFTIERQLKAYTECNIHTDRHEILWHEWNHNKRWLIQVQKLILPSFPSYSMHDSTHSETVLHNIEMLLGEDNIKMLSATDCFLILHTVYIHDIGMCITYEDKKKILEDNKFHKFLELLRLNGTPDMSKYAQVLLRKKISIDESSKDNEYKSVLKKKLEVYNAITYLLAEFRRTEHGDVSRDRLIEWINSPSKLGIGFSAIEIPSRLFYIIANCANTHTKWDFNEVLKLHQEDSGFAYDYVHPRFIAILLQLGDALDMDNNRFHPLVNEYLGELPRTSEIHYGKHKAIRRLRITNQKISISADCQNQDELRLVRQECDGIRQILKNASYFWSVIRPKEFNIGLPTFDKTELLLKGNKISEELVEAKFKISQEKAFSLLEGNNIYINEKFVFLRELLQNAIDATKLECFLNYNRRGNKAKKRDDIVNPNCIKDILSLFSYSVEIEFSIARRKEEKIEEITEINKEEFYKHLSNYEYGVLVKINDFGTGISSKDVQQIISVGTSYKNRKKEIDKMPPWLQPTGTFGIGLQSVFLCSDVLIAKTYTRKDENYEITFYPFRKGSNGYINVMPLKNDDMPYGTCFEVFISNDKKMLHAESPETWEGTDPFEKNYNDTKIIRHSYELMKQMAFYLSDIIGIPLFPINLHINDICEKYNNNEFKEKFKNSRLNLYVNRTLIQEYDYSFGSEISNENSEFYFIDLKKAKLYIWDSQYNAYACFGINRILFIRDRIRFNGHVDKELGVQIFYKGIKVSERNFKKDSNLIEYIDLKGTLDTEYLKLNRNGFSEKGNTYINEVYEHIILSVQKSLEHFITKTGDNFIDKVNAQIHFLLEKKTEKGKEWVEKNIEELILFVGALIYFAMIIKRTPLYLNEKEDERKKWNDFLKEIINLKNNEEIIKNIWANSTLFNIPFFPYKKDSQQTIESSQQTVKDLQQPVSVLDIINNERKFAIFSIRKSEKKVWDDYIIEITDIYTEIKNSIVMLRTESNFENRINIIIELSKKTNNIMQSCTTAELKLDQKSETITKWFLHNVPTIAVFSQNNGNTRLNVLGLEINDSVYLDIGMKLLTIEKMRKYYTQRNNSRFSTVTWSGYSPLSVNNSRCSILFVKRGNLSGIGRKEMIFPLTGAELETLYITFMKSENKGLKMSQKNLNLQKNLKTNVENCNDLYKRYIVVINKILEEESVADELCYTFWAKLTKSLSEREDLCKDYMDIDTLKNYTISNSDNDNNSGSNISRKTVLELLDASFDPKGSLNNELLQLIKVIFSVTKIISNSLYNNLDFIKISDDLCKEYIKTEHYNNLINYMVETKKSITREQIETSYYYLICEIIITFLFDFKEEYTKDFDQNFIDFLNTFWQLRQT